MNNSKTILALVLVVASTLLTTTAVTTVVPVVYADDDHKDHDKDDHDKKHDGKDGKDGNKNKAEDDSAAAIADCDKNDVERAGFDCLAIPVNGIGVGFGNDLVGLTELGGSEQAAAQFAGADGEEEEETETEET